jgi:type IV pilus assembly protein PilQ
MRKLIITLAVSFMVAASSYSAAFVTLDKTQVQGNDVIMNLSGPAKYHAFKIANPPRLVIEFTNTEHNVKTQEISVNGELIKRVRSGQFQNEPVKICRVVIDLKKLTEYQVKGNGNAVTASFVSTVVKQTPKVEKPLKPAVEKKVPPAPPAKPSTVKNVVEPPVEEPKTQVAAAVAAEPLEVEPPIQEVVAKPIEEEQPDDATENAKAEVVAAKVIVPEPAPKRTPAVSKPEETPASKQDSGVRLPTMPVSIDFQDADIRDVLRVLAMKSGVNVIYGPDVEGNITIKLDNVPFNKAFDTILTLKGLVRQEQSSNILRIATPQKISDERSQAVTFTKIFPLNYAKAEEVKGNLDSVRQAEGRKGNIAVDSRTNSLIITDTPEGLENCLKIISDLDKKPQQVCIEARIVEMVVSNTDDLGIQWQYAKETTGSQTTTVGLTNTDGSAVTAAGGGTGVTLGASPVNGAIGAFSFGVFKNGEFALSATLSALAQRGLSKILSAPKVTTINNQQARILVGQKIPYTTTTVTQAGSTQQTQFLDVGVKMTVIPTINADKRITLYVKPEVSLYVRADAAGPVIGSREAETTVLVNDGDTVVIGGLITDQDIKNATSVPLLGDIPIIGHLFRRDYKSKDRTELLVFITPRILEN